MTMKPALFRSKELFEKVKFRTKFEVAIAEWNPKINLIAIGSREGDVVVKRYLWKTGWKRNFSREQPKKQFGALMDDNESTSFFNAKEKELLFLCWSPGGHVLLVVFRSGRCYYLDTQTGNTLYSKKLANSPISVGWLKFPTEVPLKYQRSREQSLSKISATDLNFNQNASKDHMNVCSSVENFYNDFICDSLVGSFLCTMHSEDDQKSIFIDIFVDGILLIRRVWIGAMLSSIARDVTHLQTSQNEFFLKEGKFHLLINKDGGDEGLCAILQFSNQITQEDLLLYNQIADCIGWMSFCCVYLQETFIYSANNWKQSSEAFHQRIFATINSSSQTPSADSGNDALEACRHLLAVLEENAETSKLIEAFLSSPASQKELKQAGIFLDEYTILINGISFGLQPAAENLRHSICLLRSLLTKLTEIHAYKDECMHQDHRLLDTMINIASGHSNFGPSEHLNNSLDNFLTEFLNSVILLESKLQKVLDLAEQNKNELQQLINWLVAIVFETGNDYAKEKESIDVEFLSKFLSELLSRQGFHFGGKCVLDRVIPYLVNSDETIERSGCEMELDLGSNSLQHAPLLPFLQTHLSSKHRPLMSATTLWDDIQLCLQYFRTINKEGIDSFIPSSSAAADQNKCTFLSSDEWVNEYNEANRETDENVEEADDEEEEIDGRRRGVDDEGGEEGKEKRRQRRDGPTISLHSFIFGYPADPSEDNDGLLLVTEAMDCCDRQE